MLWLFASQTLHEAPRRCRFAIIVVHHVYREDVFSSYSCTQILHNSRHKVVLHFADRNANRPSPTRKNMLSLSPGRLYFYSSSAVATGGRRSISRNRITRLSKFSSRRKILSTSFSSSVTRAAATTEVASTRTSSSSSPVSLLAWYSKQLDKRPLLTKSITGGLIAGGGDLICQSIVDADKAEDSHHQSFWDCWDGRRSWNFLLLGFAFVAPTSHYWYAALDRKLAPGNSMMSVGKRVLVDQFTWTPVFMVVWLSSLWTLEGTQPLKIPEALAKSLPDVMVAK